MARFGDMRNAHKMLVENWRRGARLGELDVDAKKKVVGWILCKQGRRALT
jgi:hypothetical protein